MGLATRDYFGTLRKVFLPKMTAFHFPSGALEVIILIFFKSVLKKDVDGAEPLHRGTWGFLKLHNTL
jgi:hypothetical protein